MKNNKKITIGTSIDEIDMSARLRNLLLDHNIGTLKEVLIVGKKEFETSRNMGKKTFAELEELLARASVDWNTEV